MRRPYLVPSARIAAFLAVLLLAATAFVQQAPPTLPLPRIDYLSVAGGKQGSTVELTVFGTDLDEPETLVFSDPRIKAELIPLPPPPPVDPKAKAPPKMAPIGPRQFKVTVAGDAPLGSHDVRLINKHGVSNPRVFQVGDLTEVVETEPNNDVPMAQKVTLGSTINGSTSAGTDVDYFQFPAKKGQRILVHAAASSIDSKARPNVEVFDLNGKRLGANRNYVGTDALADVTIPEDGEYLVRLSDFTYTQGGPTYFYRLNIGMFPWIDAVFPSVIEPGKAAQVTIYGRNLPGGQPEAGAQIDGRPLEKLVTTITAPADPLATTRLSYTGRIEPNMSMLDGFEHRVRGPNGASNPVLFTFAEAPVVLETEGNDKAEAAQTIKVPCEIAGRVDRKFDRDFYTFEAKQGQSFIVELYADRIGTPSDFFFAVRNAMNADIKEEDDNADVMAPVQFYTRTSDPQPFKFTAPADGKYIVMVGSREANYLAGPRIGYRLSIVPEKPDFRLVVMPSTPDASATSSPLVRPDGAESLDVFVWRRGGFTGPVNLTVEGLPAGITCPPQEVGSNQKQATLVLISAPGAAAAVATPTVKGSATINGQNLIREARPASITWGSPQGSNVPATVRLDRSLALAVRDKPLFKIITEPVKGEIKQGEKLTIKISAVRQRDEVKVPINVKADGAPNPNLKVNNNQPLAIAADKNDGQIVIESTAALPPGTYSIVLRGSAQFPFARDPMGKQKANVTATVPALPIIVRVLPTTLGKVSIASNPNNFKIGTNGDVIVRVERLNGYDGEYKLKLVIPPDVKGVSADEVSIPTGKTDGKLTLKIAGDAAPGGRNNLSATVTGMYEGKLPIVQDAKFNINVVK